VHYRVWRREELQRRFRELKERAEAQVQERLRPFGGLDVLFADGTIESGLGPEFVLPLEKRERPLGLLRTWKLRLKGTPWDLPKP
jgi:hypothetical protein